MTARRSGFRVLPALILLITGPSTIRADNDDSPERDLGSLVADADIIMRATVTEDLGETHVAGTRRVSLGSIKVLKGDAPPMIGLDLPAKDGSRELPEDLDDVRILVFIDGDFQCHSRYIITEDDQIPGAMFSGMDEPGVDVIDLSRTIHELVDLQETIDERPGEARAACERAVEGDLPLVRHYAEAYLKVLDEALDKGRPAPAAQFAAAQMAGASGEAGTIYAYATLGISALALASFVLVFLKCWRESAPSDEAEKADAEAPEAKNQD